MEGGAFLVSVKKRGAKKSAAIKAITLNTNV